jgi:hypothetical protein
VVASLALLSLLAAPAPGRLELLDVGSYRAPQLPRSATRREWLALCRGDGGVELKKVTVEVQPRRGRIPAREVTAPGCPYALALLRGPALRPGPVPTVEDQQGIFTFHGARIEVRRDAPGPETDAPCGVRRVHLILTAGDQRQVLAESDYCTVHTLRWGGDLDGDGKLDLLVAENLDDGGTILRLFLSSRAPARSAVGPAGTVEHGVP